jgi:hypothetical protein
MKNISLLGFLFCISGFSFMSGQSATVTGGGNAMGSGGTVSYSIGQVTYSSVTGINGSVIEGVQQPFEISVVTAVKNSEGIKLEFNVYPNPAADFVKLFIATDEFKDLRYQLFNFSGLLLLEGNIEGKLTEITMQGLSSSTYFLKVLSSKREIKTFKIIKK